MRGRSKGMWWFVGEHARRSLISISCVAALVKSHFSMGVSLRVCCVFLEHLFVRVILGDCFCLGDCFFYVYYVCITLTLFRCFT